MSGFFYWLLNSSKAETAYCSSRPRQQQVSVRLSPSAHSCCASSLPAAAFLAPLPVSAQDGSADDLGVMLISLKDVVKPNIRFQGALQGAGIPNQAGIGGFFQIDRQTLFPDVAM